MTSPARKLRNQFVVYISVVFVFVCFFVHESDTARCNGALATNLDPGLIHRRSTKSEKNYFFLPAAYCRSGKSDSQLNSKAHSHPLHSTTVFTPCGTSRTITEDGVLIRLQLHFLCCLRGENVQWTSTESKVSAICPRKLSVLHLTHSIHAKTRTPMH